MNHSSKNIDLRRLRRCSVFINGNNKRYEIHRIKFTAFRKHVYDEWQQAAFVVDTVPYAVSWVPYWLISAVCSLSVSQDLIQMSCANQVRIVCKDLLSFSVFSTLVFLYTENFTVLPISHLIIKKKYLKNVRMTPGHLLKCWLASNSLKMCL